MVVSAHMDFSEVGRLSANLDRAAGVVSVGVRAAVTKGALNIKNDTRKNVSKHPSWKRLASTVNYSMKGNAFFSQADVGYDDRGQGELAGIYEFGSSRRAPNPTLYPAADREAPKFEAAIATAAAKALGDVL